MSIVRLCLKHFVVIPFSDYPRTIHNHAGSFFFGKSPPREVKTRHDGFPRATHTPISSHTMLRIPKVSVTLGYRTLAEVFNQDRVAFRV
ncbi:MAG: hypothetical protein KAH38_12000 [Candidatus Hydrogenedentes bacterium]|nr:hypothetical protein [Candidatus Hydrogenedentota bacterium]